MAVTLLGLAPEELRVIEGLSLQPRQHSAGSVQGERLTQKRGISIDFRDFREYSEGDDLRHLDWNILARHETPILKTHRDEEDLTLTLAIDCSASMAYGSPSKFELAQRISLALGFVALQAGDAVSFIPLRTERLRPTTFRGRPGLVRFAQGVTQLKTDSQSFDLSAELKRISHLKMKRGITAIITDALHPEFLVSLRTLSRKDHEVWVIQILSQEELQPNLEGDLSLVDCETGEAVEITINRESLKRYQENLRSLTDGIKSQCLALGGRSLTTPSHTHLVSLIRDTFLREKWLA
ncbi:MAG: DUF58 domain-containing protein [Fimbriimonadaceae bacterium]|jgi:uncharacterized protein (DUF58 family)|nr:DUF58 domain-containing protein [Fimbriimonadaceae bacterium]